MNTGGLVTAAPSALTLTSTHGSPLLEIFYDGTVEWHGPPSKGARALIGSVRSILDLDTVGHAAADRIYRKALQRSLNMARSMSREEFIDRLEQELQARQSKAVLRDLTREDNDQ